MPLLSQPTRTLSLQFIFLQWPLEQSLAGDEKGMVKDYWPIVAKGCFLGLTPSANLLSEIDKFGPSRCAEWDHVVLPLLLTSALDRVSLNVRIQAASDVCLHSLLTSLSRNFNLRLPIMSILLNLSGSVGEQSLKGGCRRKLCLAPKYVLRQNPIYGFGSQKVCPLPVSIATHASSDEVSQFVSRDKLV